MKRYLMVLIFGLCAMASSAQTTMRDVWLSMPDSMFPYLNKSQRLEHVELLEMNVSSEVKNLLGGEGRMDTLTDQFMQMRMNGSTDLQLRLLLCNDSSQVICMVKTVKAPLPESEICFFTADWTPIESNFGLPLKEPADSIIGTFFVKNGTLNAERLQEIQRGIDPVMVSAMLFPNSSELVLELCPCVKTARESALLKAVLRQRKFKWNGLLFKKC